MNEGKNKGITLIALVITIIVILIISGISFQLIVGEEGMIGRTTGAKNKMEIAETLDKIKIEIGASYNDGGKLEVDTVKSNIITYVEDVLSVEGTEFPLVIKTNKKKVYILREDGAISERYWFKKEDGTITDGVVNLKIGDYILYDHTKDRYGNLIVGKEAQYISYSEANSKETLNKGRTNGGTSNCSFSLSSYTGGWRVLGVDEGSLKLISENSVGNLVLKGKKGYIYGIDELNAISFIYGQGKGAKSARSITVQEINDITGYNPNKTGNGEVRAKGKMWEYGNVVTYFWQNGKIKCTGTNGLTKTSSYTVFKYYDEPNKEFVDLGNSETIDLKSCSYNYYPDTLTESTSGELKGIAKSSDEYKMLFNEKYWLASSFIGTGDGNVGFGIFQLDKSRVYDTNLYEAANTVNSMTYGVKPVILLSNDIEIIKNETKDGSTKAKACILSELFD